MEMESYITMENENTRETRSFYVYNDGRARETGHGVTIQDFAGFYLFLAGDGWKLAKETNIPVAAKGNESALPLPKCSRRAEFKAAWHKYVSSY